MKTLVTEDFPSDFGGLESFIAVVTLVREDNLSIWEKRFRRERDWER